MHRKEEIGSNPLKCRWWLFLGAEIWGDLYFLFTPLPKFLERTDVLKFKKNKLIENLYLQ